LHFFTIKRGSPFALHPELAAQVHFPHHFISQNYIPVTSGDNGTVGNNKGFGGNFQGVPDIVVGNQDADALFRKTADNLLDLVYRDRINSGKRLVQKQEFRLRSQRPGNLGAPPLPAGKGKPKLGADSADAEFVQQAFQPVFFGGLVYVLAAFQNGPNVLFYREFAKNRGFLGQLCDALPRPAVHGLFGDVNVIHNHHAFSGLVKAHNHVENRGFPRAVWPQKARHLAVVHGKVYPPHHLFTTKAFVQVFYSQSMNGKGVVFHIHH
jgi:hypothetical protein